MTPFLSRAPDVDAPNIRTWFLEPATMVDQVYGVDSMNGPVAKFIVTELDAQLRSRFISRGAKVRVIHDWTCCVTYEAEARAALIEWGKVLRPHVLSVTIGLSPQASPFLRIATLSAMALLRVVGMKIDLVDDFAPVRRELRALAGEPSES